MSEYEPDGDALHDLLLEYMDSDVRPVTAAEARARAGDVRTGGRPVRQIRRPRTELVVGLVLVASLVIVGLAVVARSRPGPAASPTAVLWGTDSGPCVGAPPGCGSTESTAAALATGRWSRFPAGPLSERSGQAEVWTGKELLIWGGAADAPGAHGVLDNGAAYDPATKTWRLMAPSPLSPRQDAAVAWTGSEMVIIGGIANRHSLGDAAAYDPSTNTWRVIASSPVGPLTAARAVWTGRQLIVVGGYNTYGYSGSQSHSVAVYDPATNSWTTLPDLPVAGRWLIQSVTPVWTGHEILVWMSWQESRRSGLFDRDAGYGLLAGATKWQELPNPPVETNPVETNNAATSWTGKSVLVMGGEYCPANCPPPVGFGAAYYPATRKWKRIASFSIELGQWPAIWTGRAFIDTNDGHWVEGSDRQHEHLSAYSPLSGKWVRLPASPQSPLVQNYPEAVWTGHQLLVWGRPSEVLTVEAR